MTYDDPPVEGVWCGQPRWQCPYCAYDSLEEHRVREHIQWAHPNDPEWVVSEPPKGVTDGAADADQDSKSKS